jgi:hypothetical protein
MKAQLAARELLGYREQEHAGEPQWSLPEFPEALIRAIKIEAAASGRTITEVLADELSVIADRLESKPESRSSYPDDFGQLRPFWVVKHFPEGLRDRLKEMARHEEPKETDRGTPLYRLVARELWAAMGVKP